MRGLPGFSAFHPAAPVLLRLFSLLPGPRKVTARNRLPAPSLPPPRPPLPSAPFLSLPLASLDAFATAGMARADFSQNLELKGKQNCNPSQNRFKNENIHLARGINKSLTMLVGLINYKYTHYVLNLKI
jgi:hypothetical protein